MQSDLVWVHQQWPAFLQECDVHESRNSQDGLRRVRIGEASNPGPAQLRRCTDDTFRGLRTRHEQMGHQRHDVLEFDFRAMGFGRGAPSFKVLATFPVTVPASKWVDEVSLSSLSRVEKKRRTSTRRDVPIPRRLRLVRIQHTRADSPSFFVVNPLMMTLSQDG